MLLGFFIAISGIFSKSHEDLDLLPPPPPFPDISKEHERIKDFERIRKIEEKREKRELEKKREQEERERKKAELKRKRLEELEKHRKEKSREEKIKKKLEEGRKIEKKKKEGKKQKLDILRIAQKPAKEKVEEKLEMPEFKFPEMGEFEKIAEPEEIIKADEEIQKAISGMKKAERPSILKGLFKKKKEAIREKAEVPGAMPEVEEKIETPEIMPRTYDKIDYVELIEEKIHKARLFLMDFKFDDAKRVYIEVMRMYNELEPKKKSKVYQDIKDLYYERKSAEKFSK